MRVGPVVALCGLVLLVGCSGGSSGGGSTTQTPPTQAATPTFSVAAGAYTSTQTVAIADATAGAVIYYTTDGSTPSVMSVPYSAPVRVSASETLSAVAFASGYSGSAVGTAVYNIGQPPVAIAGGPYTGTAGVGVSFSGGASSDPQGQTLTYAWSFGDGSTGTGVSATHTYAAAGTYTVSLKVTDTYGFANTATVQATIAPPPLPGAALTGVVTSGSQPVVGAHVYLLAANTTGYGGAGLAASAANTSVSLLSAAETGTSDSVGAYVTTGSNGGFSLTGDYSCASGQQLYLYALSGNTGIGVNAAAGMMAVVGSCPNTTGPAVFVTVNEVTTIAAAYAMAGFATDATHVGSSGTALAKVGIANAFANAGNLASLSTGVALATTPAGNGTVPQAEINTLANVVASCINWSPPGVGYSPCATLFFNAGNGLTVPTDTATVAINIAHNPGSNIAALYALAGTSPTFTPALTAQPIDFSIGLTFTGGGLNGPRSIAIDGSGDAWIANYSGNSLSEFSTMGIALSPSAGYVGGGLDDPISVAIDGLGEAWIANYYNPSGVSKFSSSGVALSPSTGYTGGGLAKPSVVAIDGSGNAWMANSGNSVSKFSSAGVALSPSSGYTGGGLFDPESIAVDGSGNAWIANLVSGVSKLSSAGAALSPSTGYTGGGLNGPLSVAIDGSGDAWIGNENYVSPTLSEFSNAGIALSPSIGYSGVGGFPIVIDGSGDVWAAGAQSVNEFSSAGIALSGRYGYGLSVGMRYPASIAVDGSGDVWVANNPGNTVSELIGVATPVVTPICAGLPATPTVDGSSNLGTRP